MFIGIIAMVMFMINLSSLQTVNHTFFNLNKFVHCFMFGILLTFIIGINGHGYIAIFARFL